MKIIKVKNCCECPYAYWVWEYRYFCKEPSAKYKTIDDCRKMPDWCPLSELLEGKESI